MSVRTDQAAQVEAFVRQYYRWVAPEELAGRSAADVRGAALAHRELAARRAPGETKVRVYDPRTERDGWQSAHTVAEVVGDDMPFLVDSVSMELHRRGRRIHQPVHTVIRARRDADGELTEVLAPEAGADDAPVESVVHMEIDRVADADELDALRDDLLRVLADVRAAVEDWPRMRERTHELIDELATRPPPLDSEEVAEASALLSWLDDDHFTFLGFRDYDLIREDGADRLRAVEGSGLGILRQAGTPESHSFDKLPPRARALARTRRLLNLTKADSRATVHRPSYLDYVGIKRFDADGEILGERRFLGLYTSAAYRRSPREVPLVRRRIAGVLARTGLPPGGHDDKALIEVLETYPLDELLQITEDELLDTAMGIVRLGQRQRVRLFVRRDEYERFLSCLVFLPRDRFNTHNRERVAEILRTAFDAERIDFELHVSSPVLVRIHFVVRTRAGELPEHDRDALEARIAAATRSWGDDLRDALTGAHGEARGDALLRRYGDAFGVAYRDDWPATAAVADIDRLEALDGGGGMGLHLYRPETAAAGSARCKLLRSGGPVSLSEVLPMFEHMGVEVVDERPYEICPNDAPSAWICDFGLRGAGEGELDVDAAREGFQDAFARVWRGEVDDDGFNGLVLRAGLSWREVTILRAVARYLRQVGLPFSDRYVQQALTAHPQIARALVDLFVARFDPSAGAVDADAAAERIAHDVDAISSLDEDRILSAFLAVVRAMLRTNYFQRDADGAPKPHLAFKLDPTRVALVPEPRPRFEIFVDAPWTEGVHLRGGKVARGGLRWSDRREDFRTEILGLMKAQMVKNALIVPVGAKGGFVVKHPPADREALAEEVRRCYRTFIGGLLDLTDDVVDGTVTAPADVVRYDDDDPYLVVAADKGTATFSDMANAIATERGFWLGDAFASGGSAGYDHKRMGITARGAWESVKRHFRELGVDPQTEEVTVVGVGDMSGDVFGNGMLLSEQIRLVGAFDHRHVFLDPDPDAATAFAERRRLFARERSSWDDYDRELISPGGGVWRRDAKAIELSPPARRALDVDAETLTPAELIRALLCAPVDLLFNGGIGTYVKARAETHADAGDKANDAVRVDGAQLRCRVVGEGGNLGLTQPGRVEFALGGGRINTDAIDNAAGVNCSDYEVNIKILLAAVVAAGELTMAQRDAQLAQMTDDVAELVLRDNRAQALALSLARAQAPEMLEVHDRFLRSLEQAGRLDRALEHLPDAETIEQRRSARLGLTQPELAVLLAHSKIALYEALLDSDVPDDAFLWRDLARTIPPPLPERYGERMRDHRLRREIVATHVTNSMVDRAGTTFAFRMQEDTGAPLAAIARAYAVAREVFALPVYWRDVAALDRGVDVETQLELLLKARRLIERATRWLLRYRPETLDIAAEVQRFAPGAAALAEALPQILLDSDRDAWDAATSALADAHVPLPVAHRATTLDALFAALDVVEVSAQTDRTLHEVAALHLLIGARLRLHWLRDLVAQLPRATRWEAMARAALRDDVFALHARLTAVVVATGTPADAPDARLEAWLAANAARVERCARILDDVAATGAFDLTTLPVALRELRDLVSAA